MQDIRRPRLCAPCRKKKKIAAVLCFIQLGDQLYLSLSLSPYCVCSFHVRVVCVQCVECNDWLYDAWILGNRCTGTQGGITYFMQIETNRKCTQKRQWDILAEEAKNVGQNLKQNDNLNYFFENIIITAAFVTNARSAMSSGRMDVINSLNLPHVLSHCGYCSGRL